jgi:hypothetical protein
MAVTTPAVPATTVSQANQTGQNVDVAVTGGTITGILVNWPAAITPAVTTPAVPASTTPVTNTNAFPVAVTLAGGTITHQTVNGSDQFTNQAGATLIVPAGGTVAVTYSVAPTWTWAAAVAGFAGTSIASPSSVPLPPGCSVVLTYSVAPTWAWADPENEAWEGYASNNATAINQEGQLPFAAHSEGGETGLGEAVSN